MAQHPALPPSSLPPAGAPSPRRKGPAKYRPFRPPRAGRVGLAGGPGKRTPHSQSSGSLGRQTMERWHRLAQREGLSRSWVRACAFMCMCMHVCMGACVHVCLLPCIVFQPRTRLGPEGREVPTAFCLGVGRRSGSYPPRPQPNERCPCPKTPLLTPRSCPTAGCLQAWPCTSVPWKFFATRPDLSCRDPGCAGAVQLGERGCRIPPKAGGDPGNLQPPCQARAPSDTPTVLLTSASPPSPASLCLADGSKMARGPREDFVSVPRLCHPGLWRRGLVDRRHGCLLVPPADERSRPGARHPPPPRARLLA